MSDNVIEFLQNLPLCFYLQDKQEDIKHHKAHIIFTYPSSLMCSDLIWSNDVFSSDRSFSGSISLCLDALIKTLIAWMMFWKWTGMPSLYGHWMLGAFFTLSSFKWHVFIQRPTPYLSWCHTLHYASSWLILGILGVKGMVRWLFLFFKTK